MYDNTVNTGLYHKLHGVHRPETMKKTIIKRRKRVVLPNGSSNSIEQPSVVATTTIGPTSTSTTQPPVSDAIWPVLQSAVRQLSQHNSDVVGMGDAGADLAGDGSTSGTIPQQSNAGNATSPTYNPRNSPSPMDFTPSFRSQSPTASVMTGPSTYNNSEDTTLAPLQLNQHHPNSSGLNQPLPRKRSISIVSGDDSNGDGPVNSQRLNSISSILNPHSGSSNIDIPIEPSLLGIGSNGTVGEDQQRIHLLREKRLRLMREQERLSEEMEALDKEMETMMPLDGGGSSTITQETGGMALVTASTSERNGDRGGYSADVSGASGQDHMML